MRLRAFAAMSPLICWVDTSITGAPMTPNGGKITLTPHANGHVAL